jgi:Na+/H+ antiporter NhaD/arsenite permease-like protein
MISIITLIAVFFLIAVRQIGNIRFSIWQIMLFGAFVVLVTGQISPLQAVKSINLDVILFLFGVFIIGQALVESGYLSYLSFHFFKRAKSLNRLVLYILFGMGILSALLMNDTLAIIGTPIMLSIARKNNMKPNILLLTLAFAVTIGSVMSPIGNPQNLLIAIHGNVTNPFITFFRFLFLPTLINLFLAYLLLRLFYREHFHGPPLTNSCEFITDRKLANISRFSLILLALLVLIKMITVSAGLEIDFRLTYIALISALPVTLLSRKRWNIIRKIDWYTLIFFSSMFILMQSVWDSSLFQTVITSTKVNLASISIILFSSVIVSQFISNVPMVALYLPMLTETGASIGELMALAAGSTIAGNLTILGAASNVIIIQNAELKYGNNLTFLEFVKVGIPMTIINLAVYWIFISFV